MKITWVPSKKARDAGIVPPDYTIYDIDTAVNPIPESSTEIMLIRAFRHMYNNECASAYLAAEKKAKAATPPTTVDRAEFLHTWRTEQRTKILEGKLGMRESAVAPSYSELEQEARQLAFNRVVKHIKSQGGEFNYKDMNKTSLAKEFDGKTVEEWMADLMDESTSRHATKLWKTAQENVDRRHEQAEEDDDSDVFGSKEDESEEEEESAAAK